VASSRTGTLGRCPKFSILCKAIRLEVWSPRSRDQTVSWKFISPTSAKLKVLGDLEVFAEKPMAVGSGLDSIGNF
jgi:hypothetical protein